MKAGKAREVVRWETQLHQVNSCDIPLRILLRTSVVIWAPDDEIGQC
jgi:hypothetical protein